MLEPIGLVAGLETFQPGEIVRVMLQHDRLNRTNGLNFQTRLDVLGLERRGQFALEHLLLRRATQLRGDDRGSTTGDGGSSQCLTGGIA